MIGFIGRQMAVFLLGRYLHQGFQHGAGEFGVNIDFAALQRVEQEGGFAEIGFDCNLDIRIFTFNQ